MEQYKCVIIEDEPLALERTKGFIEKIPYLNLLDTFDNALEGLTFLKNHSVDILFLDINMDELSGIELLESVNLTCEVIITTAYQQYALKGFELNVTDYLLKPFSFQRFLQAVDKAVDCLTNTKSQVEVEYIFVKTEHRLEKIMVADILYIEGMRDYRRIHTSHKKIMTLQTFSELESLLPEHLVCRVHKSYMVSLAQIEAVERGKILLANQRIPISSTYKNSFFAKISGKA